ncbi:MAG TPA: hypothetical protein VFH73_08315 [Polyangia bacterium]|nr:hypothetical protein [Polyangia bacterium]
MPLLALLVAHLFSGDKGPAPALIKVPEALARRSATLEPSGVVWSAALDRYLVVSDDTGDSDNHHQPWLLAMTRDGAFDEEPVPILGIDEINDGESICAGPNGLYFLTTSHSLNLRGHAVATRQMLLLLKLEGRALRVEGRVDLTSARAEDGGGSLLEIAGLPPHGKLDIEAVTYRDQALLIGLKAPLSASDGAVVLRLADPVAALRAHKLPPGAVTRLWEIALHVTKHHIPQGIADFTSLPDGSMVLLANSPKGRKEDRGGALYWYRPGAGEAQLLRRFKELHPEGVTLDPEGKSLVIVFDNNTGPPMWVRWPVPLPIQGMN